MMMIDDSKINLHLDDLNKYFDNINVRYFKNNKPISKYFEQVNCYNCNSKEITNTFSHKGFRYVRCKNCGMVYVNPRLKESITHSNYNDKMYNKFYEIKIIPSIQYRKKLALNKYNQIVTYFKKPGKVLDIGCGAGEVLSVFKEHKWNCLGIEFNKYAAFYAKYNFDLKVINESIYNLKDTSVKFDVILMYGVLEHLYNPKQILKKVFQLLEQDGILVIEVPSADSLLVSGVECKLVKNVDRIIEGDRHIMFFSVKSFKQMLNKAGFKVLDIKSNGLDISTINRNCLNEKMSDEHIQFFQNMLDKSLRGDLLRGFFSKQSEE